MDFQYDDAGAGGIYTEGPRADGAPINQRDKKDAEKPKVRSLLSSSYTNLTISLPVPLLRFSPSLSRTLVASSPTPKVQKKRKQAILFDARTELTNEELYAWRDGYEEEQKTLRAEMERNKREKNAVGRVHEVRLSPLVAYFAAESISDCSCYGVVRLDVSLVSLHLLTLTALIFLFY
jgi:hypothetical protein